MNVSFKFVKHGSPEWEMAVHLREKVLRKPLGSFFTDLELLEESNHFHVVGNYEGILLATAVLVPEDTKLKMQRVAVVDTTRNIGVGSAMMKFCEAFAIKNGYTSIYCHARDSAVKFYSNNAYLPQGDYFDEDGIPHLKMVKTLIG